MNKLQKVKSMNNAARMKELFFKLWFGTYLMTALTISSKKHNKYAGLPRDWTISIIEPVSPGFVSE